MPAVTVQLIAGRTKEQKREVARRITDTLVEVIGARPEGTIVIFQEVTRDDWATGGTLLSDRNQ